MPLKLVVDAVEARLKAAFTRCAVYGLNSQGETPPDGGPYVQVSYPVANGEQLTVGEPGANIYRETGAFRFEVNARRGKGVQQGLIWADELAALFRGKEFNGVQTFAPSSPSIDDRNDAGNYFKLSISIPYQADIFG